MQQQRLTGKRQAEARSTPGGGRRGSTEQDVYVSLCRTQGVIANEFARFLRPFGLSTATYDVLRALGRLGGQRACSEIRNHLSAAVPDVTRLLDRLEEAGLIERARAREDARTVLVSMTDGGRELLARLDGPIKKAHAAQLGHLSDEDRAMLIDLLEKARAGARQGGADERHALDN